jgi:hypothetical protein
MFRYQTDTVVVEHSVSHARSNQEVCCCPSAIVVAAELIGPQSLVGLAAALGKAHAYSRDVLGDEFNPSFLKSHTKRSGLGCCDRDWLILGFRVRDRRYRNLAPLRQVVLAPARQGASGTKLASSDRSEII